MSQLNDLAQPRTMQACATCCRPPSFCRGGFASRYTRPHGLYICDNHHQEITFACGWEGRHISSPMSSRTLSITSRTVFQAEGLRCRVKYRGKYGCKAQRHGHRNTAHAPLTETKAQNSDPNLALVTATPPLHNTRITTLGQCTHHVDL